ncbi:Sec23/Sec24 trunk domain-containing protein [Aphelenchoides bicaudatus]|nr:Sec23/Sec24 trunk domain-containing protein [Aphelenchoides bicaudatus]
MSRLYPECLPDICEIMKEDQSTYENKWIDTGFPIAEFPPMATTKFLANDMGNSNPKFIRSSFYRVPSSSKMIKSALLPFTLSITPFAELDQRESPMPIVDFGEMGPVRCQSCRAYISAFFEFTDGGQNLSLSILSHFNACSTGRRIDIDYRPELRLGSYEVVATKQYCENNVLPIEPAFVFLINVSYQSFKSGLLDLLCSYLPDLLENLPRECGASKSSIKVALVTYDQAIHFYDMSSEQPRMCVLTDINDVFVPFIEGLFIDYDMAREKLKKCLNDIRRTFTGTHAIQTILGPAIDASMKALRAAGRCGKIFVFHTSLPTLEAPGCLKNREDRQLLGTEKEKTVLTEAIDYYSKLGEKCVKSGVCVDMFFFPNEYVDIASIAPVSELTGGSIYKYQYFDAQKDGKRFLAELQRDISRPIGFDVKVRVRTSVGIRPTGFYGAFFMDNVTDMQIGALDCDKSIQVEIKHDNDLNEKERVYIQVATLFTSVGGQRRLRIHNLTLPVTSDYVTMYSAADQDSVFAFLLKHAESIVREKSSREMRGEMINRCAHILASYRENCTDNALYGQLVLPEALKLLPLVGHCILRSEALNGGPEITVDDKAYLMRLIPSLRIDETIHFLYPTVIPITSLALMSSDQQLELPGQLRASAEFLQQTEAYIVENGLMCFIWIGSQVAPEWIQNVFGVQNLSRLDTEDSILPERDNPHSRAVRKILASLSYGRSRQMQLVVVKPGDRLEPLVKKFLVEDRYGHNSPGIC